MPGATADYPGITTRHPPPARALARRLGARSYPFYFCQIEAIETLIWWVEAPAEYQAGHLRAGRRRRVGAPVQQDGHRRGQDHGDGDDHHLAGAQRARPIPKRNKDFSRAIFVVAPGLTVKERLRVLYPGEPDNYYDAFGLCPSEALRQKLNQAEMLIENWHTLMPLKEPERSVVKKGAESDEAFTRRVLGKLAGYRDLVSSTTRRTTPTASRPSRRSARRRPTAQGFDLDEATRWIEGLDRIHDTRRIQRCFDLSATPFAPTGKASTDAGLFDWIVSDFGLNDAIEAGLVKTPRVVIRDDALPRRARPCARSSITSTARPRSPRT